MHSFTSTRRVICYALLLVWISPSVFAQDTLIHYTETTGFDHRTREVSLAMFQRWGEQHGFVVLEDGDGSLFNKTDLAKASIVIFSNTSGNEGLDADQRAALEWYVDTLGGSLLGIHAASDTYRHSSANGSRTGSWDWYAETLGGSVQTSPNHTSQNHVDTIYLVEDHPSVERIDFPWVKEEEYYYWENGYLNPSNRTIIEVGETGTESYDARRPIAWYRTLPQGAKIFYTALGHKRGNFTGDFPGFERLIEDAVLWMLSCRPFTETLEATICAGESYAFNGQQLSQTGTYTAELTSAAGCDSIVTLDLEVVSAKNTQLNDVICAGESYTFNGQQLSQTGTYTAELTSAAGCDSIVTLDLEVVSAKNTQLNDVICAGESYTFNGQQLSQTGTYTAELTSAAGCDSIVTLDLEILRADTSFTSATICEGESYFFGSELQTAGTYWRTFRNEAGCDSLVRLRLTVVPPQSTSLAVEICEGESYSFDGRDLRESGEYSTTLLSQQGCDSTVNLSLTVLAPYFGQEEVTICSGERYSFGDRQLTEAGDYQFTFQTVQGCDSTVQLSLRLADADTVIQRTSICAGGSYQFGDEVLTEAGTYFAVYQNEAGCDSTVQLEVDILPVDTLFESATLCPGDTLLFEDRILTEAGIYFATFQDQLGCDSTVQLTVEMAETDTTIIQDGFTLSAQSTGADYQWLDCDDDRRPIAGATGASFTPARAGDYALRISWEGCTFESACFNVSTTSLHATELTGAVRLYPNPAVDQLQVDLGAMRPDVTLEIWSIAGQRLWTAEYDQLELIPVDLSPWPPGVYQLRILTDGEHAFLKFVKR